MSPVPLGLGSRWLDVSGQLRLHPPTLKQAESAGDEGEDRAHAGGVDFGDGGWGPGIGRRGEVYKKQRDPSGTRETARQFHERSFISKALGVEYRSTNRGMVPPPIPTVKYLAIRARHFRKTHLRTHVFPGFFGPRVRQILLRLPQPLNGPVDSLADCSPVEILLPAVMFAVRATPSPPLAPPSGS